MNSVLQKAFLWCVLTTLLLSITSAKPLNSDGLRRLSVWLQGRVRRDVHSLSERSESNSAALLTQRNSDTESFAPQHRSMRVKRTEPAYSIKRVERAGCNLSTCSVHELAHLVNLFNTKTNNAPTEKLGSNGYGRRRRRSLQTSWH
ncbi:pro-adrenomedullin [Labeo rohita]|uniref:pro-adrenomedullin n=1 Tax=Labeo rohita TaxID=84645 RepID=UPI0021E2AA69|nr:pro-adrenomedullin [Labeo rohita]